MKNIIPKSTSIVSTGLFTNHKLQCQIRKNTLLLVTIII